MESKLSQLAAGLNKALEDKGKDNDIVEKIAEGIKGLKEDIDSIMERDPAASSEAEVMFLYSGLHAVAAYRVAHALDEKGHKFTARAISQAAKFVTDIEIHPSAKHTRRRVGCELIADDRVL